MQTTVKAHVEDRIKRLRAYMSDVGLDLAIISSPENVFYFSNFNPILTSQPALVLVSSQDEPCLLVHAIRYVHAQKDGVLDKVQLYGKWGAAITLASQPVAAIYELMGDVQLNIGLEFEHLNIAVQQQIKTTLNVVNEQNISPVVSHMKLVKDSYEVSCIRNAAQLTDVGVQTAIDFLAAGYNEARACTQGQYQMRMSWHEHYQSYEVSGFANSESGLIDTCVVWSMANERIAYGCDCPQAYTPVCGDLVLPMSWAKIAGYSAETERTVAVGELTGWRQKAYDAMLQARENMYPLLKVGTTFEELYLGAVQAFEQYGFGNALPGRVGHGVGLSAHEHPSLTCGNSLELEPGMTFTIEPGLMDKDWGGARHSDTVLITPVGFEFLTKLEQGYIKIK